MVRIFELACYMIFIRFQFDTINENANASLIFGAEAFHWKVSKGLKSLSGGESLAEGLWWRFVDSL